MNIQDKTLVVAMYQEMRRECIEAVQQLGLNIPVVAIDDRQDKHDPSNVTDFIRGYVEAGKEIIVTRGLLAKQVREELNVSVIEIRVSGYDVMKAMHKYVGFQGKMGCIECDTYTEKVKQMADLFGLDVNIYQIDKISQFREKYEEAVADGVEVLFGGAWGDYSKLNSKIKFEMIESSSLAIRESILSAYSLFEELYEQKRNSDILQTIIDYSVEGILSVDQNGVITTCNPTAERILDADKRNLLDRKVHQALPGLGSAVNLKDRHLELGSLFPYRDKNIVVNKIPVVVEDDVTGAILFLQQAERLQEVERRVRYQNLQKGLHAKHTFEEIKSQNYKMKSIIDIARTYGRLDSTILLLGETGVGKEVFAQSIHNISNRKGRPFVAVNCSAFPNNLLESELFGYVDGAFTGARRGGRPGIFELAHEGTLFLDEIGEIGPAVQAQLLRAIQEKEVMRIGGDKVIPVDVKIIAATNKNLREEVRRGRFRMDLFYRLNVLDITIPPLRERKEDLELLSRDIITELNKKLKLKVSGLDRRLQKLFLDYDWPGNIRELNNVLEKIVVITQSGIASYDTVRFAIGELERDGGLPAAGDNATLEEIERQCIQARLEHYRYNKTKTAESLGIGSATLFRKINQYGLRRD